jgi:hypothetical protein
MSVADWHSIASSSVSTSARAALIHSRCQSESPSSESEPKSWPNVESESSEQRGSASVPSMVMSS